MTAKIALLQQSLASLIASRRAAPGSQLQPAPPARAASRLPLDELIRRRIATIARDDPQRRQRMLRLTLEACMTQEWGESVSGDPAFHALVDQVTSQMEADPALQATIDAAFESLSESRE